MTTHVFGIDLERCIGCYACTMACKQQNNPDDDMHWNAVYEPDGSTNVEFAHPPAEHLAYGVFPESDRKPPQGWDDIELAEHVPIACQHCDNAPCTKACPVEATYTREDGIVMMDYDKCIGCRYCMAACPYNVRVFNWESPDTETEVGPVESRDRGVVEKCNWCVHRLDKGLDPACVEACPEGARMIGDLDDPDSKLVHYIEEFKWEKLLENFGTDPKVYYFTEETPGYHADRLDKAKRDAELDLIEGARASGGAD